MLNNYRDIALRPLAPDECITGPDFIGVGTPKSGTSWWYQCMIEHPRVCENRLAKKEITYFQHIGLRRINQREIEDYRSIFSVRENRIVGEWSPGYMFYPLCIENIARAAPETRILVLLRNPVDRVLTQINMLCRQRSGFFNLDSGRDYVLKTFSLIPEAFLSGQYSRSIELIRKYFDEKNIKILIYEDCIKNPEKNIRDTYRFLGIEEQYIPESLQRRINETGSASALIEYERDALRDYMQDEIRMLAGLLPDADLSIWD